MSSQNSHAKDSINKISSYILFEQNIDIANFTSGHLNENHLWKPPEQKTHKPWLTVNSLPKSDESLSEIRSSKKIGIKKRTGDINTPRNPCTPPFVLHTLFSWTMLFSRIPF